MPSSSPLAPPRSTLTPARVTWMRSASICGASRIVRTAFSIN
ncbi:hypothetical protein ACFPRL_34745 [Pseudoclavibacter helvolus]